VFPVDSRITIDLSGGATGKGPGELPPWLAPAVYGLLLVLCLVTYHGITDNYLFNDDFSWISSARYEMTPSNLFTYRVVNFFRPLINVTFFAFERLAPGNIRLQYNFNILLHFICSVLVFHIFVRLLGGWRPAVTGAVMFAVSSIHTGAVFWISARTTLLSTALLLCAILILINETRHRRLAIVSAAALYALSLLAKETAIAGLPILFFIWMIYRGRWENAAALRTSVMTWAVVSAAYLVTRTIVIGGFTQHNWGPGLHMLRNTAGAFLYELRPWPFFSLFWHKGTMLAEPVHPFLPELLVVGVIAFIWYIGLAAGRQREFALGTLWALAALIPASAFRYRFYSTVSITQNRYYYLSSVGVIMLFTLVLGLMWGTRKRAIRALCVAVVCIFIAGSILRVSRIEDVWSDYTELYRRTVDFVITTVDQEPGLTAAAIENPPLAFPYIADGVSLYRPGWKISEVKGGLENARPFAPCVYIPFITESNVAASGEIRALR